MKNYKFYYKPWVSVQESPFFSLFFSPHVYVHQGIYSTDHSNSAAKPPVHFYRFKIAAREANLRFCYPKNPAKMDVNDTTSPAKKQELVSGTNLHRKPIPYW